MVMVPCSCTDTCVAERGVVVSFVRAVSASVAEAELPWSMMARADTSLFQQHGTSRFRLPRFLIARTCSAIS